MKKMKKFAALIAASTLVLAPMSAAKAEEEALKTSPLTEVLNLPRASFDDNLGDFDIFTALFMEVWGALPQSAVSAISQGDTALTAFVPTDRAFRKLVRHLTGSASKNEEVLAATALTLGAKTLEKVILYHVIVGDPILSPTALGANGAVLTTASGDTLKVKVEGTKITLIDKNKKHKNAVVLLSKVDINSGNKQVAHGINQVMLPKL
jgi:uncharacterized surface protein with fasciclin (FAS1) repeats